jgi:hypothetical protein
VVAKIALHSRGAGSRVKVACTKPWPDDCFVQSGDQRRLIHHALILGREWANNVSPFFFEAFPRSPDTYLRGEGATFEDAENACWHQYQAILNCPEHDFDRCGRSDGYARCRHCGLSGAFLEPTTRCVVCDVVTNWCEAANGAWYCKEHWMTMPRELWDESRQYIDDLGITTLAEYEAHCSEVQRELDALKMLEWMEAPEGD